MAEQFADSFSKYASLAECELVYNNLPGFFTFSASGGPYPAGGNGGALKGTDHGQTFNPLKSINFTVDGTTHWYVSFRFRSDSASAVSNGNNFLKWNAANTDSNSISGGPALSYIGIPGGGLGTSGINCQDGNWHGFECGMLLTTSGNTGTFISYIDGILDQSLTSINYSFDVLTNFFFNPGALQASGSTNAGWITNILIWTSTGGGLTTFPIGPQRAYDKLPASDHSVQYTPSTGSVNANCVNLGFSGTQNVHDASTGHVDLYVFAASPVTLPSITTVIMNHFGQNAGGSGTASLIAKVSNGSVSSGPTLTLPIGSAINQQSFFTKDPSSAAWTKTSVDAAWAGQGD